jgi:PAS domain S-box-containing protein
MDTFAVAELPRVSAAPPSQRPARSDPPRPQRAELALAALAALDALAALARHAAEGVALLRADGTIDWVDDALLRMTGLGREALLGRKVDEVLAGNGPAIPLLATIQAAVAGHRAGNATVPVLRADGQVLMVDVTVELVDPAPGGIVRYVATLVDATERRQLEHAVATVADEERQALAREVHDGLECELTTAHIAVSAAIVRSAPDRPEHQMLLRAEAAIERAAARARSITHGIVPLRRGVPLLQALETFARDVSVPGEVTVNVDNRLTTPTPIGNDADQLYRICQEAVANALRHARARHVCIRLAARPRGYELRISDDGSGFDVTADSPGKGLRMMRLRASSLGARLEVTSSADRGTVVRCLLGE